MSKTRAWSALVITMALGLARTASAEEPAPPGPSAPRVDSLDASSPASPAPPRPAPGSGAYEMEPPPPPPRPDPVDQREYGLPTTAQPSSTSLAAWASVELGGHGSYIDPAAGRTDGGGALGGRLTIMGHNNRFSYRVHAHGVMGGGTNGFLTRFGGEASGGAALPLGNPVTTRSRLFARLGLEANGWKDDVVDGSVYSIPSGTLGFQHTSEDVAFEIGPRVGLTLRSQYDVGSESEGVRHHRRGVVQGAWGGSAVLLSSHFIAHASAKRVEGSDKLLLAEGALCGVVPGGSMGFLFCGMGELWRGDVLAVLDRRRERSAYTAGASVGIVFGQMRTR